MHPTFLILGVQKAGTTWLADILRQHPDICMPTTKELHFFNKKDQYEKGLDWYEQHFESCTQAVRGEATPNYFWTSEDAEEIAESNRTENIPGVVHEAYPDLQFIVSLRDPVDRAVSAYKTLIRGGYLSPKSNILDVAHRHGILSMGEYSRHIERWFKYFSSSRFLFFIFEEDVTKNRERTTAQMYDFLNVDPSFVPGDLNQRKHPSLGSFYGSLLHYAPWLRTVANTLVPNLDRDRLPFRSSLNRDLVTDREREALREHFRDRNQLLPTLIGRRPDWLEPAASDEPSR